MFTLLTITPQFLNRFLLKFSTFTTRKPETKEGRIIRRALYVVKTSSRKKYHRKCLLRYARKSKYQTEVLLEIFGLLRVRRQHVLKAAWMNPLIHPLRSLYFFKTSFGLQSEMEDIFIELYSLTGDQFFFQEILEARFVTSNFLEKMIRARHQYLEQMKI